MVDRLMSESTYDIELLDRSAAKWRASPGLRAVYLDMFAQMHAYAADGDAFELGSGIGVMREVVPEVVVSDVVRTPYVDTVVSAYEIESTERVWSTIYAFDVLHHLREPFRFFESASRSLRVGGRIVLMEPAATWGGRAFYSLVHPEPIKPRRLVSPYVFPADDAAGTFANMAMGWTLFVRDRREVDDRLARIGLRRIAILFRDGVAYPATGGLSRSQLLPTAVLRLLLRIERALPQALWRWFGLRMLIVLEKA